MAGPPSVTSGPPLFPLIYFQGDADLSVVNTADELVEQELMLNRFNRLIGELLRGAISRNAFQLWEVELLLDLETCQIPPKRRADVLRQYQRAVARQMRTTPGPPMTLTQHLNLMKSIRAGKASNS